MSKIYVVALNGGKCLSYTHPANGRKYLAGKSVRVPESEIAPFKTAGVFNISIFEPEKKGKASGKKEAPKDNSREEKNPDDKQVAAEAPKADEAKADEKKEEKPKGFIGKADLKK